MINSRWFGRLSLIGGIAGVLLVLAFSATGWGQPGTAVYTRYELLNRLMAVSLLFMAAGWLGAWLVLSGFGRWAALLAFLGTILIAIGTAAEFWLYSDLPYNPPNEGWTMRHTAYTTASIGGLVQDVGAMAAGLAVLRSGIWPRWVAILLLLSLPLDFLAFFTIGSPFLVSAVLALLLGSILVTNGRFIIEPSTTNSQRV
jgi:hypothetical protein